MTTTSLMPKSSMSNPDDAFEDGAPEEIDSPEPAVDLDAELEAILAEQPVEDAPVEADPLADATKERDEYLDALRRTQADFENYRKRVQREMGEARDAGAGALAGKLIDVLDTVDLALTHDPSDSVAQIATALVDTLNKAGLERVDALGAAFDPEQHDAVLHEEGDGPAEVIEVLRSGWKWNGRVLRPAMVKVKGS
jgi:molecular chaperone GrpE